MRLRQLVMDELARRRRRNPRASLRGLARAIGVHHATLSRLLRGNRPLPARSALALAAGLRLSAGDAARLARAENEAAVIASVGRPGFQPSTRWLASRTGIPADEVNVTLQTLLRSGRLSMPARDRWHVQAREVEA